MPTKVAPRGARVTFGRTTIAKVPSWKSENARMNFDPQAQPREPSRETVWVRSTETGIRVPGTNVGTDSPGLEEEQPAMVADLRPLGERARLAAR